MAAILVSLILWMLLMVNAILGWLGIQMGPSMVFVRRHGSVFHSTKPTPRRYPTVNNLRQYRHKDPIEAVDDDQKDGLMLVPVVQLHGFHCCLNVVEMEDLWFKVEQIKRWFSDDALQVVRKICSFLFRSISEDKVCMRGKQLCNNISFSAIVVSFVGAVHIDPSCVRVVDAFLNNNRCCLLVLVSSEICDLDMKSSSAPVTRVSFIFKCASSSNQLNVVVSNSLSDLFAVYNKRVSHCSVIVLRLTFCKKWHVLIFFPLCSGCEFGCTVD